MKKATLFFLTVTAITILIALASCSHNSSQNLKWVSFIWSSDSLSGRYFEKASMKIPVTIEELPYKFIMQFDLGAHATCLYEAPLKPFLDKYTSLSNKLDTTKIIYINGEQPMFTGINIRLGKVAFDSIDVGLYRNIGWKINIINIDSIDSEKEIHIGTIGADLFQNRVLIIDYKLNRLAVTDTLPPEYQIASFENFKIDDGRIKIPLKINGEVEYLMFDTGSSLFSLLTLERSALKIGGAEIVDSFTAYSWGTPINFYGLKTVAPVMFGEKVMDNSIVYYDDDKNSENFNERENIWGITGNAYFLNNVVIIDYKNNRFGVM